MSKNKIIHSKADSDIIEIKSKVSLCDILQSARDFHSASEISLFFLIRFPILDAQCLPCQQTDNIAIVLYSLMQNFDDGP